MRGEREKGEEKEREKNEQRKGGMPGPGPLGKGSTFTWKEPQASVIPEVPSAAPILEPYLARKVWKLSLIHI